MDLLLTIVGVPLVNYLINLGKTRFGIKGEIMLVLVSIFLGLVYALFQYIVPELLQQSIQGFVGQVGLYAVLVYEFIIKKINND